MRTLGEVDVFDLGVLAVSVMLEEPKAGPVNLNVFPPKLNALCEGCTAAVVMHVAVVSSI